MNKSEKERLIKEILNETGRAIEDPWVDYNITNPDDGIKYYAMVGFNSVTLINDEDDEYQGSFGLNGKYIQDASRLIRDIENSAEEIRLKYADKGVKVSIGDFNVGCECGMSIYVWIPYQKQPVKEMENDKMITKICNNCKFAKETNVCYDRGEFFATYLYCFKLDDLVADDDSCDKWESDIKTIKATDKGDNTMIDIENQTCEICVHNELTEYFSTCPFFEKEEESEDCRNFAIDLGKI